MASNVQRLTEKGLISPPSFLPENTHYEVLMGSVAYGVSGDSSDLDIYGFCIPPKSVIFPHLEGEILGFGKQKKRFEQFQVTHVNSDGEAKQYDFQIFNIVKYFSLCMDNNPNMIDSLFVPDNCVLHITKIGTMVREKRKMFLHKGAWHRFKGYAYAQLHKMQSKNPTGKRKEIREQFGFDVKYSYHVIRLLDEVEQILTIGDIDVQRNKEQLKAIRRGDISEEEIRAWAADKEKQLESVYLASSLPYSADEHAIKILLLQCLEEHYGSLDKCVVLPDRFKSALIDIREIIEGVLK